MHNTLHSSTSAYLLLTVLAATGCTATHTAEMSPAKKQKASTALSLYDSTGSSTHMALEKEDPERGSTKEQKLFAALQASSVHDVNALLARSARQRTTLINTCDQDGNSALMLAIKKAEEALNVVDLLVKQEELNIDQQNHRGETALHKASNSNYPSLAALLLDHNAHIDVQADGGFTPIIHAVLKHNTDMVQFLVDANANTRLRAKGLTAFDYASHTTIKEILQTRMHPQRVHTPKPPALPAYEDVDAPQEHKDDMAD